MPNLGKIYTVKYRIWGNSAAALRGLWQPSQFQFHQKSERTETAMLSTPPSNCWKLTRLLSNLPITLISRDGLADDGGSGGGGGGTGGIGGGGDRVGG